MADATSTSRRPETESRGRSIALWVLQVLLALQFLAAGSAKLFGDQAMVDMFADIGAGQWLRYLTGTLEVAGAVGLLIPVLSGLAALCLSILMTCATIITIAVLGDAPWMPLAVLAFCVVAAWGRWPKTVALLERVRGKGD